MSDIKPAARIDVAHICELTHFDLDSAETAEIQGRLEKLLDCVEKLDELDLEGVEPTLYGQPAVNVFREDVNEPGLDPDVVLANAPATIGAEFKVPKIVE
ncbi:MAG: Asp-tRNA(Asn)/Glu-tRNA(Gln) amidotransferase subunit GatC [Kiritimatiellia bacterium]|jgi:aspartyl-tRNA(Asn)/glutamyl-tRNA(Gln) amidotransferase subunit C